jgi:exportin-5
MEHRHFTQFLKHVVELMLVSCPSSVYATHLEPLMRPIFEHIRYRLEKTWLPVLNASTIGANGTPLLATKALTSAESGIVSMVASQGEDAWFSWYYAHAGLFVGDLDPVTAEAAVEKYRVDISRTFSDVLQTAFALKGDWALVLANKAKEEQALKQSDSSKLLSGPSSRFNDSGVELNADGTPKLRHQAAIDARKMLRINGLCHFFLLESKEIAENLTLTVVQCLGYPDAYTCRRIVKICHRILETVAWSPQYTELLGRHMFTQAVKNLVTEPKWMVGIEWDMINVVRDIYCRLVLGQTLQAGGQGHGIQQPFLQVGTGMRFEQAKTADKPLQGGGVLEVPSNIPRQLLASLPGIGPAAVEEFDKTMKENRSAKEQKDTIKDLLRVAADNWNPTASDGSAAAGIFDRALQEESLLHSSTRTKAVPDLPEKLVTHSQVAKAHRRQESEPEGLAAFLFES